MLSKPCNFKCFTAILNPWAKQKLRAAKLKTGKRGSEPIIEVLNFRENNSCDLNIDHEHIVHKRWIESERERELERETDREIDREREMERDGDRQREMEIDRERERERERGGER